MFHVRSLKSAFLLVVGSFWLIFGSFGLFFVEIPSMSYNFLLISNLFTKFHQTSLNCYKLPLKISIFH